MCTYPISRRELMRGAATFGAVAAAGGIQLAVPSTALGAVANPGIYGTDAWGARNPGSLTVLNYKPSYIVIHHTATSNSTATTQAAAFSLARNIQNYHMDANGWADTGQQFTVSRGGYIMTGRHQSLTRLNSGTSFMQGAHVGAGSVNSSSIGIENEGLFTSVGPTGALMDSLVDLCAYICFKYNIPASKIYGHRDFMATACPGDVLYAKLPELRSDVADKLNGDNGPFSVIVDNNNGNRFTASDNWNHSNNFPNQRRGETFRWATTNTQINDACWYKVNIPKAGMYKVDVWHPAADHFNNAARYVVLATNNTHSIYVNQRVNGGKWRNIGEFHFTAGDRNLVGVSRWTDGSGNVVADAIRVRDA